MLTGRSALFPTVCRRCISGQSGASDMPSWSAAGGQRNSEKQSGGSSLGGVPARFTAQGRAAQGLMLMCAV